MLETWPLWHCALPQATEDTNPPLSERKESLMKRLVLTAAALVAIGLTTATASAAQRYRGYSGYSGSSRYGANSHLEAVARITAYHSRSRYQTHPRSLHNEQAARSGYRRPVYASPRYGTSRYAQPGYVQPGYAQPGYAQPGYYNPGYQPVPYGRVYGMQMQGWEYGY